MDAATPKLGRVNAAYALSAAIVILFNTLISCVKDAHVPLKAFMASLTGKDWTTQGLADVILFALLGAILSNTGLPEKIGPKRLICFLTAAVVIAGTGLFAWYALY
jgi:hypothetical protein